MRQRKNLIHRPLTRFPHGQDVAILSLFENSTDAQRLKSSQSASIMRDMARRVINVSAVPHRSPFRYPGGKTWLVPYVRQWLSSRAPKPEELIEPFAGGAIVGLTVAFER